MVVGHKRKRTLRWTGMTIVDCEVMMMVMMMWNLMQSGNEMTF